MSDSTSINALIAGQHNASVIDSLANPPQVNLLGSISRAADAAKSVMGMRALQARQAWGEALQASTDQKTGVVDYGAVKARLAGTPAAALAMPDATEAASARTGEQLAQGISWLGIAGSQSASLMMDPSDDNIEKTRARLKAAGMPSSMVDPEMDRMKAMPDPEQRKAEAYKHVLAHVSATDMMMRAGHGVPDMQDTGAAVVPLVKTPSTPWSTGGATQPPGGLFKGIAPQAGSVPDTRPGAPPGSYTTAIPPGGGGSPPLPQGAPATAPAGPAAAPAPGAVAPPPQPGAAPPLPKGAPPLPGGTHLSGGRFGPAPAAQPPVPAPAVAPPAPGPTFTAPPAQQADVLKKDIDTRTAASLAMPDQQKRLIAGQSALESLKMAQNTGPGTAELSRAAAFLQAQGLTTPPQGNMSATDYRQILVKNLLRFAQNNGQAAGTDLGLKTKLESNANADEMLAGANRHVLLQDMGILKRDLAQTREMPEASANGAVVKHIGSFSGNVAPEAFMWNEYSNDERAAIKADYAKKGQTEKLENSVKLAQKHGLIPPPPQAAPATAAPPAPAISPGVPHAALTNMLNPYA